MFRNTSSFEGPHGPRRELVLFRRSLLAAILGIVLLLVAALGATPAFGHWSSSGTGTTMAIVGTLAAPTSVSVPGLSNSSVAVTWTAPTGALAPTGYYVTRLTGGTSAPACGSGTSTLIATTSCTDVSAPVGTHSYVVTAVHRSWTAVSAASNNVSVISLSNLTFESQPAGSVTAGASIATLRVAARTVSGLLPAPNVPVTISIGANPAGGTLSGTVLATTDITGVATFSNLSIDKAGVGYSFVASSTAYAGAVSTSFSVTPATATQLVITSPAPISGVASATPNIGPITVERRDMYGNPATAGSTKVTLTAGSGGTGRFAVAAGGGAITSVDIPAGLASTSFYYGESKSGSRPFTAAAFGTPLSVPVEIIAAAPSHLKFGTISSPVMKNGFSITVSIVDAFENQTPSTATVTLVSTGQPLTGPQNKCTVVIPTSSQAGSGTFSGLTVNGVKSDCQVKASSPGLADILSSYFAAA